MSYARSWTRLAPWALLRLLATLSASVTVASAQDLVPGAFTPAPVGFNVVTLGSVLNNGDVAFDPSLPITDASATIGGGFVGFTRTFRLAGRFATAGAGVPIVVGHIEGLVLDQFQEASRRGLGDLSGRLAINLYGAPAMTRQEFAKYRPRTVVGATLLVSAPTGQYDSDRYINLGTNRWSFRPTLGAQRLQGPWTLEGEVGVVFFTDNPDYVNNSRREQAPIVAVQGHLIRNIRPGFWVAADGNYWQGGRITTNGSPALIEQKNSRVGATLAVPIQRQQVRVSYSFGAYTTIGGDYHSVGMSYSYAWAASR
jgi:hypothetical protein